MPQGTFKQFKQRILHRYFVRLDMSLILVVVVACGLAVSKLLLECGVRSLRLRYPLAVLGSYLAFLLLIRVWIWYVSSRKIAGADVGEVDLDGVIPGSGRGGAASPQVRFGGGSSGGGGASSSWAEGESGQAVVAPSRSSGSGSSAGFKFDLDLDDDWAIIVLLAVLILAIGCAAGYLVYVAPDMLPEAAWQAMLASAFARVSKPAEHYNWLPGVVRASAIPFTIVLILAGALGWVAHNHCPEAVKLAQALRCAGR